MNEPSDQDLAGLIEARLDAHDAEGAAAGPARAAAWGAAVRAIERTWDLVIPHRLLDQARDRAELVEACVARVRGHLRLRARRKPLPPAARLQVRVEPPRGRDGRTLTRSGAMTAYDAEELLDGARRWGPGTRIDLVVQDEASRAMVDALVDRARAIAEGGLEVSVRRMLRAG